MIVCTLLINYIVARGATKLTHRTPVSLGGNQPTHAGPLLACKAEGSVAVTVPPWMQAGIQLTFPTRHAFSG